MGRHRHHRDADRAFAVERTQIAEQMGGGLGEVAGFRQVQHTRRGLAARRQRLAERQQCLAGRDRAGIEPHRAARRVMRRQHAGRHRGGTGRGLRLRQRRAQHRLDRFARHAARAQQHRRVETADDGRFHPDGDRPAIDDQIDAAVEVAMDVGGGGRRHMTGAIRRRRHHRAAERAQNRLRHRMGRHANRDGGKTRGRQLRDGA